MYSKALHLVEMDMEDPAKDADPDLHYCRFDGQAGRSDS
jgi:hypothetical protein